VIDMPCRAGDDIHRGSGKVDKKAGNEDYEKHENDGCRGRKKPRRINGRHLEQPQAEALYQQQQRDREEHGHDDRGPDPPIVARNLIQSAVPRQRQQNEEDQKRNEEANRNAEDVRCEGEGECLAVGDQISFIKPSRLNERKAEKTGEKDRDDEPFCEFSGHARPSVSARKYPGRASAADLRPLRA
jgi:hypothetical protein